MKSYVLCLECNHPYPAHASTNGCMQDGCDCYLDHVAVLLDNAAQQSVHLTALRRGLAVSVFINVILLAVVLVIIGGG